MLTESRWIKTTQFPSYLIAGATIFLVAYFTLLSPSSLEDDFGGLRVVDPKDLLNFLKNESEPILAKGVPTQITPAYSLRNFDFFTTTGNKPQLKFSAKKSNFYQKEQLVHAKDSIVTLPDSNTVVTSKESLYDTIKNEIEFYGDVVTTFQNGVVVHSNYMKAITRPVLNIIIPISEPVSGEKRDAKNSVFFKSYGLTFLNIEPKEVKLTSRALVTITDDHKTQVQSDRATLNFTKEKLYFLMDEQRNFDRQFVQVHQEELEIKSRTAEVNLKKSFVDTIYALNDVSIEDKTFSSTSGKAIFIERKNQLQLTDFPQVYQERDEEENSGTNSSTLDKDTITGDLIIYNRTEDTIEVKQSNAIYKR